MIPNSALTAFIGTKAQYIKTAPVLRALDERGVPYRLIDSGQHAGLMEDLRVELGVRAPDVGLGGPGDVTTVPGALRWSAAMGARILRPGRLRTEIFGPQATHCIVHGDTPSTLLATVLARRIGLTVVHLEAGLRSRSLLHPFPEELIRVVVMRMAGVLYAPDDTSLANLAAMKVKGRVVAVDGNTSIDALRRSLAGREPAPDSGPALVTMHRVENLHHKAAVDGFCSLVLRLAATRPVRFVVHGPTEAVLGKAGRLAELAAAGVEIVPLIPHEEFVVALAAAPLVVTDGGSIQEECALLGVPTVLWRERTERVDGLGANVVLSGRDGSGLDAFVADPERWRCPPAWADRPSPSAVIADDLAALVR